MRYDAFSKLFVDKIEQQLEVAVWVKCLRLLTSTQVEQEKPAFSPLLLIKKAHSQYPQRSKGNRLVFEDRSRCPYNGDITNRNTSLLS